MRKAKESPAQSAHLRCSPKTTASRKKSRKRRERGLPSKSVALVGHFVSFVRGFLGMCFFPLAAPFPVRSSADVKPR